MIDDGGVRDKLPSPRDDLAYEVAASERRTSTIVELELSPRAEPLVFLPGQYVLLEDTVGRVPQRSYSIANAPRPDGSLSLLVTKVPDGATSTWMHDVLAVGDQVTLSGPYGTFVGLPLADAPCLYLAAGSGLAPIRSLIEAATAGSLRRAHTVLFSARTEADVLDRDRFARLEAQDPNFRFVRTLTRADGAEPRGRIPTVLSVVCGELAAHHVFIAGASGFVRECEVAARRCGAAADRIHTEAFSGEA